MDDREIRRLTFDAIAEDYERHRPSYPDALYDDLLGLDGLPVRCRVLEIGPGTGKFTRPLAERGHRVVAVELGSNLAEVLRRNVAGLDVEVVVADFETWEPPAPFDLVVSATAFHWIDPDRRWQLAHAALRPGGWIAVGTNLHVAGGPDDGWFENDMQECYRRHVPGTPDEFRLLDHAELDGGFDRGVRESGLFDDPVRFEHLWDWHQSTDEYLASIATHSSHLMLEPDVRSALFGCVRAALDGYGGEVTMRQATVFTAARRR